MVIEVLVDRLVRVSFSFEEWVLIRTAVTNTQMMEREVIEAIIQCGLSRYFTLPENERD